MLGATLALLSAIAFGMNNAAARRGVITGSVLQGLAVTVPIGVPLFALLCLANSTAVDLEAALAAAMAKYAQRMAHSGQAGSGR